MSNTLTCKTCGGENLASECILGEWGHGDLFCRCRYCGITWHATVDCLDDIHGEFDEDWTPLDESDIPGVDENTQVWVTPEGPDDPRGPMSKKRNR